MRFRRTIEIERGGINLETGEFPITLFSDGEASDGHILSIEGGRLPDEMPLFINHDPDPESQLGTIRAPVKQKRKTKHVAQIELGGDGPRAEIRRDIAFMIDRGHVRSMSGRWDAEPEDVTPRTNLPSDHPAFVDASKAKGRKRWGLLFKRWTAMEGSVVGLGADPQAVIGRGEETDGPVRDFWGAFAREQERQESDEVDLAPVWETIRLAYQDARARGAELPDVLNALEGLALPEDVRDLERVEINGAPLWLPARVAGYVEGLEAHDSAELESVVARLEELCNRGDAIGEETPPGTRASRPEGNVNGSRQEPATPTRPNTRTMGDMPAREFFGRVSSTLSSALTDTIRTGRARGPR